MVPVYFPFVEYELGCGSAVLYHYDGVLLLWIEVEGLDHEPVELVACVIGAGEVFLLGYGCVGEALADFVVRFEYAQGFAVGVA